MMRDHLTYTVTPADLIYGYRIASTATNKQYEVIIVAKSLTRWAKYQWHVLNSFIKQRKRDFLLSLQERRDIHRSWSSTNKIREIKEGDIVIIQYSRIMKILDFLPQISPQNQLDIYFVTSRQDLLGIPKLNTVLRSTKPFHEVNIKF